LSALFIKYYPDLGRAYHISAPMFTGVATSKNSLGQICLICGIYFAWTLIYRWHEEIEEGGYRGAAVNLLFIALIAWLLYMADSATSVGCLIAVAGLFVAGRVPVLASEPRRLILFFGTALFLFSSLELSFGLSDWVIESLGRSKDLTTRVPMWEMLLAFDTNPLIGVGYESFWSGDRISRIWQQYPGIIQAHNGYLDMYLNVGLIGLMLFLIAVVSGFAAAINQLKSDYAGVLLRIAFMIAVVLNNWTEATIKPVSNLFVILLLGILGGSTLEEQEEGGEAPSDVE